MKSIFSIAGGILFALLFHNQYLGINLLIFSSFLIVTLLLFNKRIVQSLPIIASIVGLIGSAIAMTWHGSSAALWSYFISLFTFLGFVADARSSVYVSIVNGVYNMLLGIFHTFIYPSDKVKEVTQKSTRYGEWILGVSIPLILLIVFIAFYRNANPVFDAWIDRLLFEIEFVDMLWLFTASIATFLMFNVIEPQTIHEMTDADAMTSNQLTYDPEQNNHSSAELNIGTYSLVVLNLLLLAVLVSEFMFLSNLTDFAAADLSRAVHHGVYSSIASVIVAISLIAFVFRGSINWIKSNKWIKLLATGWMVLNSLLLVSIALKTLTYITTYGLTEKRIGVLIYLTLCLIGIVTVFFKVHKAYKVVFMVRKNLSYGCIVLALFSWVNWSAIITSYNIEHGFETIVQLKACYPQNALVLKKMSRYDEVVKMRNSDARDNYESIITDRNWREFNYTFYIASNYDK